MLSSSTLGNASTLGRPDPTFYSPESAETLRPFSVALAPIASDIVRRLLHAFDAPRVRVVLASLTEAQREALVRRHTRYLRTLVSPRLTPARHQAIAMILGRLHEAIGVPREEVVRAVSPTLKLLRETLPAERFAQAHYLLSQRLVFETSHQIESYQVLQHARASLLTNLGTIALRAQTYPELIAQCSQLISDHPEIGACAFLAPNEADVFGWEYMAGDHELLRELLALDLPALMRDMPGAPCVPWQAWRTQQPVHCLNAHSDPRMTTWRGAGHATAAGSVVCVPVTAGSGAPRTLLVLVSRHPGGYDSHDQRAFVCQLRDLVAFAINHVEPARHPVDARADAPRQRWSDLIRTENALQVFYQPIIDLKTGGIVKAEALARLRDGSKVIAPAQFFPGLSAEDFYEIYLRGLHLALTQGRQWIDAGLSFRIALNLPASAVADPRYLRATTLALARTRFPSDLLELELLETDALPGGIDVNSALECFKALGIALAEDDLGSGHSSLNRLRQLPFDTIKIDRAIVRSAAEDPTKALRFIYQLTRLGHSLGKTVVVEGVEDAGMLEAVRILGADAAQGYVIAAPMPAEDLGGWIGARIPFRAPLTGTGHEVPAHLAHLIIWEEKLHLLLQGGHNPGYGCVDIVPPLPFHADAGLHRALVGAAGRFGMRSDDYEAARQALVHSIRAPAARATPRQLSA